MKSRLRWIWCWLFWMMSFERSVVVWWSVFFGFLMVLWSIIRIWVGLLMICCKLELVCFCRRLWRVCWRMKRGGSCLWRCWCCMGCFFFCWSIGCWEVYESSFWWCIVGVEVLVILWILRLFSCCVDVCFFFWKLVLYLLCFWCYFCRDLVFYWLWSLIWLEEM